MHCIGHDKQMLHGNAMHVYLKHRTSLVFGCVYALVLAYTLYLTVCDLCWYTSIGSVPNSELLVLVQYAHVWCSTDWLHRFS